MDSTKPKSTHLIGHKTSFTTVEHKMHYRCLPFGCINAPATFQMLLQKILREEVETVCVQVYINDIIISKHTKKEHYAIIKSVLDKLALQKLILSFEKLFFFRKSLKYLGYVTDENGASTNENVVK